MLGMDNERKISAGIAAIGLLAMSLAGYVSFTTPGQQACEAELAKTKVELAVANTRLELLTEAKDACKDALKAYAPKEQK